MYIVIYWHNKKEIFDIFGVFYTHEIAQIFIDQSNYNLHATIEEIRKPKFKEIYN